MALPDFVYAGASSPEAYRHTCTPSETVPDLSVVTGASLEVTRPNGTVVTWAVQWPALVHTTGVLTIVHVYAADGSDVPAANVGGHTIVAKLTIAGGTRRTVPKVLRVLPIAGA